ncbi:MAG: thiamine-phosphate kinase [Pyrinomonadaceae bacterium]|nr:thiamine-phosphate kinase [Pyrinomonadaceae bacterium]
MRGEFDFINFVRRQTEKKQRPSGLAMGIGDDAAVVTARPGNTSVVTTDLLIEDIDFRRHWTPPRLLGHKALAVSLSDIAAMGARPRWTLISIGVPSSVWKTNFPQEFYRGFFALADQYDVALIGGDISGTPDRIVVNSTVIGEMKQQRHVLRAGARSGDLIFVTGKLGGASAGLRLLEAGGQAPDNHPSSRPSKRRGFNARELVMLRQLSPTPRVGWGIRLGEQRLATAMIDISDGLSSDLTHLTQASEVGATIEVERIPVDPLVEQVGMKNHEALALALHGGEDFELLFSVRPRNRARVPKEVDGVPATLIGEITDEAGRLQLQEGGRTRVLKPQGFVHFAGRGPSQK